MTIRNIIRARLYGFMIRNTTINYQGHYKEYYKGSTNQVDNQEYYKGKDPWDF